jgi:O-acetylhomoserine/O-acetylserine sulfhydrylase-like pyridoxal-dependent enzyme
MYNQGYYKQYRSLIYSLHNYSRLMNPANDVLEKRLAALDGGAWTLFAQTLKKLGIEVRFFDPGHPEALPGLIDANTRLVCRESIGNPRNAVPDFHRLADIAHWHGLPVVVDNTLSGLPLNPVTMSPALRPALSAGPPGVTLVTNTPCEAP